MDSKVKLIGGLDVKSVYGDGAVFEVNDTLDENAADIREEEETAQALKNYLKLECLEVDPGYDGNQPFLSLSKRMQPLLQDGKIMKRIMREGYGAKPEPNANVNIHYNGYLQHEAEPFDSTYVRKKTFTFTLGQGEVIEGLEMAVLSMKLTEKSQFLIGPELAYRNGGLGRIPPNSQVLFEVELCEVKDMVPETTNQIDDKNFEVVYPKCLALCVQGKKMFRQKDFQGATKVYMSAVNKLEYSLLNDYDDQLKSEELLVRLYTNLLVCYTHCQLPKKGCTMAQNIYEMAKNKTFQVSAKVYFNHAKCQRMLGGYQQAYKRLSQARALEPNNEEIQQEFQTLKEAQKKYIDSKKKFATALVNS